MSSDTFERIATDVDRLSFDEQLRLMERLARNLRQRQRPALVRARAIEAMANDPDIQRELRAIEAEFAVAEADGLDKTDEY